MARRLIPVNGWTPTQKRIIDLLSDRALHARVELISCLNIPDDESARDNLNNHISDIRAKLRARGLDVVCVLANKRVCYKLYRLMPQE